MADNQLGDHIQGCLDEGKPASQERPVLIAGKDAAGNVRDLPIDAAGNISVDVITSPPVSGTVTANQGTPNTLANGWPVEITDGANVLGTPGHPLLVAASSQAITGTISGNGQTVVLTPVEGSSTGIEITGVWVGNLVADVLINSTWVNVNVALVGSGHNSLQLFTNIAANNTFILPSARYTSVRIRATAWTSGAATVTLTANLGVDTIQTFGDCGVLLFQPATAPGDGQIFLSPPSSSGGVIAQYLVFPYVYTGTWDRKRSPGKFHDASANAAGSTALWTPAAGKKFRLMRYRIDLTDDATLAVAGRLTVALLDGAADIAQKLISFVPATALDTSGILATTGWIDLGNGILSSLANNVLNVNLSAALATGVAYVTCGGMEE